MREERSSRPYRGGDHRSERHRDRDLHARRDRDGSERQNYDRHREDRRPNRREAGTAQRDLSGAATQSVAAPVGGGGDLEAKRAAWRAKKAAMDAAKAEQQKSAAAASLFSVTEDPSGLAPAYEPKRQDLASEYARKQAEAAEREATYTKAMADDEDALDAFMSAEVMPEVKAKQEEIRQRELAEKKALLERIKAGEDPSARCAIEDEEPEAIPDLEIQVPKHKVKLIVGAGGERIKSIQRKSKTRIQVKKEEAELERGFGTGPQVRLPGKIAALVRDCNGGEAEMSTIMIYGESHRVQIAKNMLLEAVENREQKQKQRQKEYDKKKDEKRRNRQIYLMRHARDYEILEVAIGTPKSELKAAYRKLALKWHPDRHVNNPDEAKAKFQEISKAYELLMSTDEEAAIKAIQSKE
eukprot:jgi/Ulvmu1/4763/UM020_0048.1